MNPEIKENHSEKKLKSENEPKENFFKEIVKFTILALVIVIPIRTYIAQPFIVNGPSMYPTFNTGQYVIVDEVTYRFNEPQRGDVIIFKYPLNPKTFYIKRIIGLPGETLVSTGGKVTVINNENPKGFPIDDSFVDINHRSSNDFKITLGKTEYFVMGDNRAESSDSRIWGPLDRKLIVGRAFVRLFPFSKISVLPGEVKI
jgi:signal peptidase I